MFIGGSSEEIDIGEDTGGDNCGDNCADSCGGRSDKLWAGPIRLKVFDCQLASEQENKNTSIPDCFI